MSRNHTTKKKQYRHEAKCIFCGNPANSKEHLWPKWAASFFPQKISNNAHTKHTVTIQGPKKPTVERGQLSRNGNPLALKLKIVCTDCNNGWMSKIEEKMKLIFGRVFIAGDQIVSLDEQATISSWCRMKLCLHQKIYPIADFTSGTNNSQAEQDLSNQWDTFRRTGDHSFSIFIARTSILNRDNTGSHNYTTAIILDPETNSVVDAIYTGYFSLGPMIIFFSNSEKYGGGITIANDLVSHNPHFLKVSSRGLGKMAISRETVTFEWIDLALEQNISSDSNYNSTKLNKFRKISEHAPKGQRKNRR